MPSIEASDGISLYVGAHGARLPLLLSCGLDATHESRRPLVAAGARVVLWDYRGHGRSEAPGDPAAYHMGQVLPGERERTVDRLLSEPAARTW